MGERITPRRKPPLQRIPGHVLLETISAQEDAELDRIEGIYGGSNQADIVERIQNSGLRFPTSNRPKKNRS